MSKVKAVLDQIEAEQQPADSRSNTRQHSIVGVGRAGGEREGEAIPISTENVD
jgi:hypothetical protein